MVTECLSDDNSVTVVMVWGLSEGWNHVSHDLVGVVAALGDSDNICYGVCLMTV